MKRGVVVTRGVVRAAALTAVCAMAFAFGDSADSANAVDLSPQDFAYGAKVVSPGDAAAFRVSLPLDVYQKVVRADLGDLRVFNGRGEVVPYALERPRSQTTVQGAATSLPLFVLRGDSSTALAAVRIKIESGAATVNVQAPRTGATGSAVSSYVLDGRALDAPVSQLEISWPDSAAEFAGRLRVEASDDLGAWRTVVDSAPIANLHAGEAKLIEKRLELPATRSKFWRLSWAGEAAPFEITAARAEPADNRVDVERATLVAKGAPVANAPGEFEFDLGAHVPADRINIELPELNSVVEVALLSRARVTDAWRPITRSGFYRLKSVQADLTNGSIAIAENTDRYWRARADVRGGGLGHGTPQLRVGWIAHDVVFLARGGGPFTLAYGSSSAGAATASLGAIPHGVTILRARLGDTETLGGASMLSARPAPTPFPWKSTVLWTVLGIGVALLALMAYRLAKEIK